MSSETFISALKPDLPVLFAYVGWADRYDGSEAVQGGHGYLKKHPYDNSEAQAFATDMNGIYFCGIGRGGVPGRFNVVFVALDPKRQVKRIVGLYAGAKVQMDGTWAHARARAAVCIPVDRRPKLATWPAGQGMRRWAKRNSGKAYPTLQRFYERLKADLPKLVGKVPSHVPEDQTYSDMEGREGQPYKRLVMHRKREARLRKAKINAVMSENKGHLVCEVPRCGFDFFERYGNIGYGYAHVHHRLSLSKAKSTGRKTTLNDLTIVCANCHAMIHRGGECREDWDALIPRKRGKHARRK